MKLEQPNLGDVWLTKFYYLGCLFNKEALIIGFNESDKYSISILFDDLIKNELLLGTSTFSISNRELVHKIR